MGMLGSIMKIKTEYVYPPIPLRTYDWCAYDDDTYDGAGSTIGWGPTKDAAIDDLLEQLALDSDDRIL
jgi:hypothetical protein